MRKMSRTSLVRRLTALLLCLVLAAACLPPLGAYAQSGKKNVRVGWYESPFNTTDKFGRRSGYAYEYQMKIAAYAGWSYTYISGSWSDLLQMLMDGEIDLLSDVSYTEERAERILYPELAMGTEEYCIYISPKNRDITPEDYSTLNGRRIGVNKDSLQAGLLRSWMEQHGVRAELIELSCSEAESEDMLENGRLDAYVALNAYGDPERLMPVTKIGSSDFYFAVSKDRGDLLQDLDAAMSRIQDENPYYNQRMFEKYVQRYGSNAFLTGAEQTWLEEHGTIRVGYQDNYLAFCAADPRTGELVGALKDYLAAAGDCAANAHIDFTATAYPTAAEALEAMQRGEVDCVFPANLGCYDAERLDLTITPALMRTEVFAVVRQADESIFARREHVIVAVNKGNPNYEAFLQDHFPNWRTVHYDTTEDCLQAVEERVADCVLVSSYRYNNISRLCEKYRLTSCSTGVGLDYCFAVRDGERELYSILAKVVGLVPNAAVDSALSYYITQDARRSLGDFLTDNLPAVLGTASALLVLILALLLKSRRAERRAKSLIAETETDKLTGLYNKDYFFVYAERLTREHPGSLWDAIVLNIEQFHSVNALKGREFGDQVLQLLGGELHNLADTNGGIAGRIGADSFEVYCRQLVDYRGLLDRLHNRLLGLAPNTSIRLRMGVMPGQPGMDPLQQLDRARTACAMAREEFKEHLVVFDETLREKEALDQRLLSDLRRALDNYEFEVYYQPKYDIRTEPPKLVSAEALVRWQHPELGLIPPDRFIPLLERSGRIGEVDKFVWDQAARQVARWRAQFGRTLPVSVNLSRLDVFDPNLEETLEGILQQNGLSRDALKLEVTESAYTEDAEHLVAVVSGLRGKGYTVEMDDFGTGYSSLNMLSAMPVDVLKMDRAFIRNIDSSERDIQLVALILGIARNLKVPVVAEGVETEEQLKLLRELGCTLVQGYYFSRPLHPSDFETMLLQREN